MAYRVELGGLDGFFSFFDPIVSGAKAVGRLGQKAVGVFKSGVVQDTISDAQDVINELTRKPRIEDGQSSPVTEIPTRSSSSPFQTRTSLIADARARQQASSAKLPLLLGAGALVAILLLRK